MKSVRTLLVIVLGTALAGLAYSALAQQHTHEHAITASPSAERTKPAGARQAVKFPRKIKDHQLANMREHLLTVSRIQEYLSQHDFDKAADLAENRLGMSSLSLHGAHQIAPYMPKGMQELGEAMHRAASKFAIATQEAAVDNDVGKALGAFAKVTQACVACHAAYRLQ
jgi:hypothetical protein